jgi:hypothetical protein
VTFSYVAATHVLTITAPAITGDVSHFDLARKDCLGTARDTTSMVWYTVANGVLSDVYYPTVDNTNLETLQYVVSDGSTFTDLQTRDMTYTAEAVGDSGGMACNVTATAKSGKYTIETDYITDPSRNTVLMRVHFMPQDAADKLYVRFDPTVNGNGGGGSGNGGADSATVDDSTGHPVLVAYDTNTATTRRTGITRSRCTQRSTDRSRMARVGWSARRTIRSARRTPTPSTAMSSSTRGCRSAPTARRCSLSASARLKAKQSARPRARSPAASTGHWPITRRAGSTTTTRSTSHRRS